MPRRQERSVLCHELRHAQFEDVHTFCGAVNKWQEQRADSEAARLLIDVHDLADALLVHQQHLPAVAVALRVSINMLEVRLKRLHPSERHLITRRLDDAFNAP
jgi:Zn-dependent peptidase ImmA (M78 family)